MRKLKLLTLLAATLMTANMWAGTAIGTTGLEWELSDGTLTISYTGAGTTAMPDYNNISKQPWKDNRGDITALVIGSGVTAIGRNNFASCTNLATVTFNSPNSVTSIGNTAFQNCSTMVSLTIPEGVTTIGSGAIHTMPNLTTVTLPSTLEHIGINNFKGCTNLTTINVNATTPPTFQVDDDYEYPNFLVKYPTGYGSAYANAQGWILLWDKLRDASTNAQAPVPAGSGNCGKYGDNVTYAFSMALKDGGDPTKLADYEGTLTIDGSGEMDDYMLLGETKLTPWYYTYTKLIHHIDIKEGVTHIAGTTFMNTSNVKTYIIPSSITYIGGDAFWGCDNPEAEVFISANPASLEWWDNDEGANMDPDDFLWYVPTPFGEADIFLVQSTKCYVPSEYLSAYKAKWAKDPDTDKTNVNVYFASRMWDGETKAGMEKILDDTHGQTVPVVTLVRPLNRDGYFATLCLPFSMTADQIQYSSLAKAEIKEFTNATVSGGTLNIEFTPVTSIEAGKPYFVKFPEMDMDALDRLDFMNITIDKTAPVSVTHGGLTMTGTYVPKSVSVQTSATDGDGVLFLGQNNQLFWPNVAGNIKPFRAYFSITGGAGAPMRRGMPARIVEKENSPTAIENTATDVNCIKALENGMFFIEKNGVRYNAQGQIVK